MFSSVIEYAFQKVPVTYGTYSANRVDNDSFNVKKNPRLLTLYVGLVLLIYII
jgi:hypothetical protein